MWLFVFQGGTFGSLYVFDRDLTPILGDNHNKYVGTWLNTDPWIKETFDIKNSFTEKKAKGIRETVHNYRKYSKAARARISYIRRWGFSRFLLISELVLKRNLHVTENRTLQLDYLVNDTTYPGLEGTVLLHFNVTILPVQIHFPNVTHIFTVSRRASPYAQVLMTAWLLIMQTLNFVFGLDLD